MSVCQASPNTIVQEIILKLHSVMITLSQGKQDAYVLMGSYKWQI